MRDDGCSENDSQAEERERNRVRDWQARIKETAAAIVFAQLIALMLGCGFLFIYFIRHRFYPGAMSASDSFGLLFLVFGCAVVWVALLGYATVCGYPFARAGHYLYAKIWPPRRFSWKRANDPFVVIGALCIVPFVLAAASHCSFEILVVLLGLLGYGMFASVLVFGRIAPPPDGQPGRLPSSALDRWYARQSDTSRAYAAVVFTATGVVAAWFPFFQDAAMRASGFQKGNVSVQLDKADFARVSERAALLGLAINPCEIIDNDSYVLNHADILWYQAGTRSLLRFPTVRPALNPAVDPMAFEYESSKPIANVMPAAPPGPRCDEVPADMLFAPGRTSLRAKASDVLAARLAWLADEAPGQRVRVTVYGDDAGRAKDAAGVTLDQAKRVANWMARNVAQHAQAIEVTGMGATLPKLSCKGQEGKARKRCEAANRRVEIRIVEAE